MRKSCAFVPLFNKAFESMESDIFLVEAQGRPQKHFLASKKLQHTFLKLQCKQKNESPVNKSAAKVEQVLEPPDIIPGTPITRKMNKSPMNPGDRNYYVEQVIAAIDAAVADGKGPIISSTLLVPDMDPSLDVYDRRYLLTLAWTLVQHFAFKEKKVVKVLTQNQFKYGGLPLSVAGLMKTFQADLLVSIGSWTDDQIFRVRTGDIDPETIEEDDDIYIIMSPQNTISAPVVNDFMKFANVTGKRPVIVLNGRLQDVPSHSGVMQVQGRKERLEFIQSFFPAYMFKLLYTPGTWYPIRGVLYRVYPRNFILYKRTDDEKGEKYTKISEFEDQPNDLQIENAFRAYYMSLQDSSAAIPPVFSISILIAMLVVGGALLSNKALLHL